MSEIGGLYVLIDPSACKGRDPIDVAEAALEGGASILQWRDKLRDKGDQLRDARAIFQLCREHGALFIANDHADLALVIDEGPDRGRIGVHLGQHDLRITEVARIVPGHFVIGISTNNKDEARLAESQGASYIAVGDIFGTTAKQGTRPASPARLAEVKAAVRLPVIGIGGINKTNLGEVIAAGADGIAVITAVCGASDPRSAARELVEAIEAARRT